MEVTAMVTVEAAEEVFRKGRGQKVQSPLTDSKSAINLGCRATSNGFANVGLASHKRKFRQGRPKTNSTQGLVNSE